MYCSPSRPSRLLAVRFAALSLALSGCAAVLPTLYAGESTAAGTPALKPAQQAIETRWQEAAALMEQGQHAAALTLYEQIYASLPSTPEATATRAQVLDAALTAGLQRIQELTRKGDISGALAQLDQLDKLAPKRRQLALLRERLNDPDRFPPALTPAHVERVKEVERLLTLANSQRQVGTFDQALASYESVLRIDPYNTAARRGMEAVEQERSRYFDASRDHQRSRMLNSVNEAWEAPKGTDVSSLFGGRPSAETTSVSTESGQTQLQNKLRDLVIDRIDFSGVSLDEVLEYLRVRSRDLDPTGKGIAFVNGLTAEQTARPITLSLRQVPIEEVLRYVTEITGASFRVENYAIRIISLTDDVSQIITKSYRVPPNFISTAAVDSAAPAASADPFASASTTQSGFSGLQLRRLGAQEFLQSQGISFPEGTGASYSPATNLLIVRNTAKNLEIVDTLVSQALNSTAKQVVINVRAVEIGQTNLQELGFDWLLGGFGGEIDVAGGTQGNQQTSSYLTDDFVGGANGNPITAGLRSSGDLLARQTIESVLANATPADSKRSPGTFSIKGVLTRPQFQLVVRALDQKEGGDLLAKPEIVTRSGQKASVQIVRELIYPTEFDPPQIPTNAGGGTTPVTPATPTAFDMRRVGVILDVEPIISEDGRTLDLTISPEITEFIGFVNYGSPINSVNPIDDTSIEMTDNRIYQPIFATRRINTAVKIYDGATVVLGGLISDNNIMIEDKVPVAGDIPVVGRMFRSKVSQRRLKNMLFFVTAKVIDPSGARLNQQ